VQVISGTNTTNYLWDEQSAYGDVLIEADNSWNIQTSYTLGNGEIIGQNRSSTLSYYLMDGHSGVRGLTNSSGSLTDSYAYGAFGDLKNSTGITANNYRYTGQQFDSLTGLYSLRARYYNPNEGRFLSRDTWGVNLVNPIELNRYGYVANNPINLSDPSGLVATVSYAKAHRPQQDSRPAQTKFFGEIIDIISEEVANFMIMAADNYYKTLRDTFLKGLFNPDVTIGYAEALTEGKNPDKPKRIIAISDYVNADDRVKNAISDFKKFYENLGFTVVGGNHNSRPKHAEQYLEKEAQKLAPKLQANSNILGGVSNPICKSKCQTRKLPPRSIFSKFKNSLGIIVSFCKSKCQTRKLPPRSIFSKFKNSLGIIVSLGNAPHNLYASKLFIAGPTQRLG
jgi:RHS repeat-associated protein